MRSKQLLAIAVQAEKIRLRRQAASLAQRAVLTIAGSTFICWALAFGEYAGYRALRMSLQAPVASLIAAAANLAVAVLFLALAARHKRDRLAAEAKLVRNNACRELQNSLTMGMAFRRFAAMAGLGSLSSTALAGLAAKYLGRFLVIALVAGSMIGVGTAGAFAGEGQRVAQITTPSVPPVPTQTPVTNQTPVIGRHGKTPALPEKSGPAIKTKHQKPAHHSVSQPKNIE